MIRRFPLVRSKRFASNNIAINLTPPPAPAVESPAPSPPPTGTLFAQPDHQTDLTSFFFSLFTDAALTVSPDTPATTATVTHVKAYASANANTANCDPDATNCVLIDWIIGHDKTGDGACGQDFNVPWGSGRDSTAPPPQGAVITEGDCSFDFDPTAPLDVRAIPPLAYDSFADTINGVAGTWTLVLTITTDIGDVTFVCGTSFCA